MVKNKTLNSIQSIVYTSNYFWKIFLYPAVDCFQKETESYYNHGYKFGVISTKNKIHHTLYIT